MSTTPATSLHLDRTVLVLGATGTTGAATAAALRSAGARVRLATRDPARLDPPSGTTAVAWSWDDASTWAPALAGVDALFFVVPPFRPDEAELGAALVEAARAAGVARIVKLSAAGVEHAPDSGHRRNELAIEASGLQWVHLRPTFFMENLVNFQGEQIRREGVIALPAGDGRSAFVAAADIGEVAVHALLGDANGEAWTLTGDEALTYAEVAALIAEAAGREVRYVDVEPEAYAAGMRGFGMPELAVQTMAWLMTSVREHQAGSVSDTVSRVLGRPATRFATWARTHADRWRA
jgi:uncharacterized protein YbjT (DUF2867 family)